MQSKKIMDIFYNYMAGRFIWSILHFQGNPGAEIITDRKDKVLYLSGLFVFQNVIGNVVYRQLGKKY